MNMTAQEAVAIVQVFFSFRRTPSPPIASIKAALAKASAQFPTSQPKSPDGWSQTGGGAPSPTLSMAFAQQKSLAGVNKSAATPQITATTPVSAEQLLHALLYFNHIQIPATPKPRDVIDRF